MTLLRHLGTYVLTATLGASCQTGSNESASSQSRDVAANSTRAGNRPAFDVMATIADGKAMAFTPHVGRGDFDNYLAMNLPKMPAADLAAKLDNRFDEHLQTRGEAHITVISPVEFQKLRSLVSIQEINQIAERDKIQESPVEVVCLGRGKLEINHNEERTYYVVVKSVALADIRREIFALFQKKGGRGEDFNPELFFPHITVGFTKRDLHYEDGVIKDESSCEADLILSH
jgi:hypothetical protein